MPQHSMLQGLPPSTYAWAKLLLRLLSIGILSFVFEVVLWGFGLFNVATLIWCGAMLIISLLALWFVLKPQMANELVFQNLIDKSLFFLILIFLFLENGFMWFAFGFCELSFLCDSLPPTMRPFVGLLFGGGIIWLLLLALTYWRFTSIRQPVIRSLLLSLGTSMAIAPSIFSIVLLLHRFVSHVEPFNHL